MHRTSWPIAFTLTLLLCLQARAEEGMWTFDNLPLDHLKATYGFTPTQAWLDQVRLASVRFLDGGSGAFVSRWGLVATNHHVAVGQLQKMSSAEKDYVSDGFYAAHPEDEIKCADLEVNVLLSTQDVTSRVMAAVKPGLNAEEALKARLAEQARIEKESMDQAGLQSEVVSLYHGGEYWLYLYRKYTDVRLVWAPEKKAAFFGGDADNFTYPRHDLDVAFFRVYDDGKPLQVKNFLRWSPSGAEPGELVFISGHPGGTDRLDTVAELELSRDTAYQLRLDFFKRILETLVAYGEKGEEQARRSQMWRLLFENALKAYTGQLKALTDPELMASKLRAEKEFRSRVQANPEWKKAYGGAWERIETVLGKHLDEAIRRQYQIVYMSHLAGLANGIVKYVHEVKKPDAERLDGFHDSELERLRFKMFSPAPIYRDLDAAFMEDSFRMSLAKLGEQDRFSKIILELGGPRAAAEKLAGGTGLTEVEARKKLVEGGIEAVEKSTDPLIVFARQVVPILVENEKWFKKNIQSVTTPAGEQIARARFAVYGKQAYPDATFTLRLTFGQVKGYPMNGTFAPPFTTLFGLYDRAIGFGNQGYWTLPDRFWERQGRLELSTPVNFVCECDIIGGNSGSPVINRDGELVGVVFDGNIESLSGSFFHDPEHNRAVAVHSAYVLEALRKLYDAHDLADEIEMQ